MPEPTAARALTAEEVERRLTGRRRRRLRLLGAALLVYGLAGIAIFVIVALGVTRPLERARRLSESVEEQRTALVTSLDQAETTIRQMATGVEGMDTSLAEAKTAIDRASQISSGVASSMYQLRDAMYLEIPLVGQPLAGLAGGFDQSGQNLLQLSSDVAAIGIALDANRADVVQTTADLDALAITVGDLATAVRNGPGVAISASTLDAVRLALYAVAGWLLLLAIGCTLLGVYLLFASRRPSASI